MVEFSDFSEINEINDSGDNAISKESMDKFDELMGDDKIGSLDYVEDTSDFSEINEINDSGDYTISNEAMDKFDGYMGDNKIESLEYDEEGFRQLTEDEKGKLIEKLGWDDKAEGVQGCKINEEGIIRYPCRNRDLAGMENPLTGVMYEKNIVEIKGYKIEVVMPKFESKFDANLPENLIQAKDKEQFCECNKQLYDYIQGNPEFAKNFSPEQIEQIKDGITRGGAPEGYTWHHDASVGKMQLVDSDIHGDSRHTGGNVLWGGGIR